LSGSPVQTIRRLQQAIYDASGHRIPALSLVSAIVANMEADILKLNNAALQEYHRKLRNWQLADSIILHAIEDRQKNMPTNKFEDPEPIRLRKHYDDYFRAARRNDLIPMAFPTFKKRAAHFPYVEREVLFDGASC
jgi:hypothetical protein